MRHGRAKSAKEDARQVWKESTKTKRREKKDRILDLPLYQQLNWRNTIPSLSPIQDVIGTVEGEIGRE